MQQMSWRHLNARVWRRATARQPGERSSWPGVRRKEASSTPRGVTHNKLGKGTVERSISYVGYNQLIADSRHHGSFCY